MVRQKVPASLRQAVWLKYNNDKFYAKCAIKWCNNTINPFLYEIGHDIPHSKGGKTSVDNLYPICSSCNRSMSDKYTIKEFSELYAPPNVPVYTRFWGRFMKCFKPSQDEK